MENILNLSNRSQFRDWLLEHASIEEECWVALKRGKPEDPDCFYYIDAVEEALCFGWIDNVNKIIDGQRYQRFSPRAKKSPWSELNKERARRLLKLGLMTPLGMKALPKDINKRYKIDKDVELELKKHRCWKKFKTFPELYQRIRSYNVAFYRKIDETLYQTAMDNLIKNTKDNKMFGEWNDYGRLLNY